MKHFNRREVLSLTGLALLTGRASAAERWIKGRHYYDLGTAAAQGQPASSVKVTEIFSYGCSGCDAFLPYMQALERRLPAGAVDYLPASWHPAENWPLFQRTYLAAKALGVDRRAHEAMFAAIWKTGELAIFDPRTKRLKSTLPSLQDVARFYQRVAAVPEEKFVEVAKSFAVDTAIRNAEARMRVLRPESTPTLVVNGRYRVDLSSTGGSNQLVEVALFLAGRPPGAA